jgi:hypothetical protein
MRGGCDSPRPVLRNGLRDGVRTAAETDRQPPLSSIGTPGANEISRPANVGTEIGNVTPCVAGIDVGLNKLSRLVARQKR